ncbi:MAG: DNA mismatch repair protein MutS [Elusimicrobia bacterium]|nr:DNA mismatch repair protein MutS [Elusimicrobiota bacterium]
MPAAESMPDTPLMRQYQALKASHPYAILFFRLGDFYEMFGEDAKAAAPVLGLVLTARQGLAMCGVPHHSSYNYIAKLLKAGHKVAVAEQMEDPSKAKGLVARQVVRLVTPGTVVEDELLDATSTNYLLALEVDTVGWGLACVEVSTGEFWATQALNDTGYRQLLSLVARLDPAEVLIARESADAIGLASVLGARASVTYHDKLPQSAARGPWAETFQNVPWRNRQLAAKAALKARAYVADTRSHMSDVLTPAYKETQTALHLDETAIRTLELASSAFGDKRHSLWGVLDKCRTPMGSRKLKNWILHPLTDVSEIERRLNCVEELLDRDDSRWTLAQILGEIADIERVTSRLATRSATPRDLAALRDSLLQLASVRSWLADQPWQGLATYGPALEDVSGPIETCRAALEKSLADRPPMRLSDGGVFRTGADPRLDELRSIKSDSKTFLAEMEARERQATGIPSLKTGFNSVFGYFIEVTKTHQAKVPARYSRKQTLTHAERYITPELKELEAKILGAEDKILRLEADLFESLRAETLKAHPQLLRLSGILAELDVLASLAEVARQNDYVKPKVDLSFELSIEDGRHPVVEQAIPAGAFVPNSISLNGNDPQIVILTGPNMGGKSTYLRQNALVAIMAQMGSFVPAKSAVVGIVDKVLTRIGSQDALSRNESTFMVEMRETAHILQAAGPRSLIILDEVGRGTSTFDGISIAWAVLEHLHSAYRQTPPAPRGPRTLFATHYFELTELASLLEGVRNANVEAREWTTPEGKTEVVFLHKIADGPADRSFGIHVAQLAGLPETALRRAREILSGLENNSRSGQETIAKRAGHAGAEPELPLFDVHPVLDELKRLSAEDLTPLQALNKIAQWKKQL